MLQQRFHSRHQERRKYQLPIYRRSVRLWRPLGVEPGAAPRAAPVIENQTLADEFRTIWRNQRFIATWTRFSTVRPDLRPYVHHSGLPAPPLPIRFQNGESFWNCHSEVTMAVNGLDLDQYRRRISFPDLLRRCSRPATMSKHLAPTLIDLGQRSPGQLQI